MPEPTPSDAHSEAPDMVESARPWASRGRKGPTVIGDEGFERDRLPDDAEDIGGGKWRDSEGGIWTVVQESEGRWAQRGGQYRRRLRRLRGKASHSNARSGGRSDG